MKWHPSVRHNFKKDFAGESFTLADVMDFIRPHFQWDEEKAKNDSLANEARSFIKCFKDGEGVREAIAYTQSEQDEPRQIAYNFFDECEDSDVLKRQEMSLEIKISGLHKTKSRIAKRRYIVENQMTIFDFNIKVEKRSAKESG